MHKNISDNVSVIILCGGRGTRLGNLGLKINKTMLPFKGKPIIYHILKYLFKFQIDQIIIPYGYKGLMIKKYVNKKFKKEKINFFNAGKNTSIINRIKKSIKFIEKKKKIIIIMNGDSIYKFNLKKLINKKNFNNKTLANLVCTNISFNFGFIKENKRNKNIEFNYKKGNFKLLYDNSDNKNYFYSGMCAIDKNYLIKNINNLKKNFEVELFNKISKLGKLKYIFDNNLFLQVNTMEDLKNLNAKYKK